MGTFSQLTDGMDRITLLSGGNCNSSTEACNPFHVQIVNRLLTEPSNYCVTPTKTVNYNKLVTKLL